MNLTQIKQAIEQGKTVYYANTSYKVIKDNKDQYLVCHSGGSCIGLTWANGVTLNGDEHYFYIGE